MSSRKAVNTNCLKQNCTPVSLVSEKWLLANKSFDIFGSFLIVLVVEMFEKMSR